MHDDDHYADDDDDDDDHEHNQEGEKDSFLLYVPRRIIHF
jgi:ABC-type Zn2+ transport system substrate-binding protein/surface adhesin